MAKTLISGKRIRLSSLSLEHLKSDIKIPEHMLNLVYPTHSHVNKEVLDKLRYTGVEENIDLKTIEQMLTEITSARRDGLNLGGTIDAKADKELIQSVIDEINIVKGDKPSVDEAIRSYDAVIDEKITNHIGAVGHEYLDAMHADYINSKNGHESLNAFLETLSNGGGNGVVNLNLIKPWTYEFIVTLPDTIDIPLPYTYTPNSNCIEVFEGPLRMKNGDNGDYTEIANNKIRFNYPLEVGMVVRITGVNVGTLFEWRQQFTATKGQREFSLLDSYNIGMNELVVYESGLLMKKSVDYIEAGPSLITFTIDLPQGSEVVVYKRR